MIHLASQTRPATTGWRPPVSARAEPVLPRRRRGGRTWPFLSHSTPRTAARDDRPPSADLGVSGACPGAGS